MPELKSKPKAAKPVQQPLFSIPDLSCGTPEHQLEIATFMSTQSPEQVQTIKNFFNVCRSGHAINGGYKKTFHFLKEYFVNVPTTVKLT